MVRLRVWISISDPWEFATDNGESRTGPVVIEDAGFVESSLTLSIRLDSVVEASGIACDAVFAPFCHATSTRETRQRALFKRLHRAADSGGLHGKAVAKASAKNVAFAWDAPVSAGRYATTPARTASTVALAASGPFATPAASVLPAVVASSVTRSVGVKRGVNAEAIPASAPVRPAN